MSFIEKHKFSDGEIIGATVTGLNGQHDCVDLELALEQPEQTVTLTKYEIKLMALDVGLEPIDMVRQSDD